MSDIEVVIPAPKLPWPENFRFKLVVFKNRHFTHHPRVQRYDFKPPENYSIH